MGDYGEKPVVQIFIFSAGSLRCAIPLASIQSVIQMMEITPSEGNGKGSAGVINLHGRMIPVYPMGALLGSSWLLPRLSDMLVIARVGDETVALWIDDTRGVEDLEIPSFRIPDPEGTVSGPDGISITDTGIIVISDLHAFLAQGPDAILIDALSSLRAAAGASPLKDDSGLDSGQVSTILAERATKMLIPEPGTTVAEMTEILRFQLAYQDYAVEMKYVKEVILTGEITPVPGTPDFISGICAARGQIISLVDLRALFRIPEKGLTDLNRVIVITDGKITFGILADTITGAGAVALDHIGPAQQDQLPGGRRYLKGIMEGGRYLLDAAAILSDPGIIVDDA
jgi:purine-binding chemotaxis protein CheW